MSINIRPGTLRAYAFGVITGSIVTASLAVWTAPAAKADTGTGAIICNVLDQYPSISGVIGIGLALVEDGYTEYDAGQEIGAAVVSQCPEYIPLMNRFIALYGDNDSAVA